MPSFFEIQTSDYEPDFFQKCNQVSDSAELDLQTRKMSSLTQKLQALSLKQT